MPQLENAPGTLRFIHGTHSEMEDIRIYMAHIMLGFVLTDSLSFLINNLGFTHVDEMVTDLRDICGNLRNVPAVVAHATFNLVCCFGQQDKSVRS
jgi:hypothetical protein